MFSDFGKSKKTRFPACRLESRFFSKLGKYITYAVGYWVCDVYAMHLGLAGGLEQIVDAVGVNGTLEFLKELARAVAERLQEVPLLILGLDVRFALVPKK
jgi:hypothetical protein